MEKATREGGPIQPNFGGCWYSASAVDEDRTLYPLSIRASW